ncbi:sulfotransferase family protein [Nocardiopsis halotolerans]|uniref:sulfotransferase family protein n=1 Tax=Nocardiopsis halotolerans TaxID=124252 RepID=UPI00036B1926|nr:sulfotransferase [Nocardiopsis halotolerans]
MNVQHAWWLNPVNTLLGPFGRWLGASEGTFDAMLREVSSRSGLPWPSDETFLADTRVLHDAWQAVPGLTPVGRISVRGEIRRRLETRLRMLHLLDANPEVAAEPVERPVFITGLPRTGTTFGHGLLAQHVRSRAPMLWELLSPVPDTGRPGERTVSRRERLAMTRRLVRGMDAMGPGFQTIHPMHPMEPEECVFLLPHGLSFHVRAPIPGYRAWVEQRDATPDYAYLKQQLQALQWKRPARRWVLKSPLHLPNLDALLNVFPDAVIVLTDRDPARAMASWASLTEAGMRLHNSDVDPHWIGREWLEIWAGAAERARRVRRGHDPESFVDLPYDELVPDPVRAAERVWTGLGEEFGPDTRARTLAYTRGDRRRNPGGHRYSLDRYGLTAEEVYAAFGPDLTGAGAAGTPDGTTR